MATLVLSAVGSLIGGPIGGTVGALLGSQIDSRLFGPSANEGPRLTELSVTTSSYGQPIPQHFGRMRAAGTVIWSTELQESKEKSGGGKGQPKTISYSYSASFAVALASKPIERIGRIWADGNLLRGSAGDLKVGGMLRVHRGRGDQPVDPLIASAKGSNCPAFRGTSYAVFEDLQLADFGNRIPALTFEIFASDGEIGLAEFFGGGELDIDTSVSLSKLAGFSNDGGGLIGTLAAIDKVYPLAADAGGNALSLSDRTSIPASPISLPEPAAIFDADTFGQADGKSRQRETGEKPRPGILRYYDTSRDYQPGLQRAEGRARPGREQSIDFPGALASNDARSLANSAAQRADWEQESLSWRIAELDTEIHPGTIVRAPGEPGFWRVATWEWRDGGIEIELSRMPPLAVSPASQSSADPGNAALPIDQQNLPTKLMAFGLPSFGVSESNKPEIYAAASSAGPGWQGAALFIDGAAELAEIGETGRDRSTIGYLTEDLPASSSILFEPGSSLEVELVANDLSLESTTLDAVATGSNRAWLNGEIIQFSSAEPIAASRWRLTGLLRGRGGTEHLASLGHSAGAEFSLIDDTLVQLDPSLVPSIAGSIIAAIGLADVDPVEAAIADPGVTLRPLTPVHPTFAILENDDRQICWTRRARGAWDWPDQVDTPLVEESELYQVGIGSILAPTAKWEVSAPQLVISASTFASLSAANSGAPIWVRQIGRFAISDPLLIKTL